MSGSLYFFALIVALALCIGGGLMAHRPKRPCPRCTKPIAQSALRCRHCGYEMER
jgi:hypothetical protein